MPTGADEQLKAEYRRLLDHEMFGLNIALMRGQAEAAELKLQAVQNYMKRITLLDFFAGIGA